MNGSFMSNGSFHYHSIILQRLNGANETQISRNARIPSTVVKHEVAVNATLRRRFIKVSPILLLENNVLCVLRLICRTRTRAELACLSVRSPASSGKTMHEPDEIWNERYTIGGNYARNFVLFPTSGSNMADGRTFEVSVPLKQLARRIPK
jgi:hypothetical protein